MMALKGFFKLLLTNKNAPEHDTTKYDATNHESQIHYESDESSEFEDVFEDYTPSGKSIVSSDFVHPVVLKWKGGGEEVYVSGSYDRWQTKVKLHKSTSTMYTIIDVPEGIHQYKFNVDGEWLCEPTEPTVEDDKGESFNNIVKLTKLDRDIFCALNADDPPKQPIPDRSLVGNPPSCYSQYMPPRDKGTFNYFRYGPPQLPPHLLQCVLNAEISHNNDPTLLPFPNHVTLNHVFTLSIKDDVMVLSGTHRFREKRITTILYRPV